MSNSVRNILTILAPIAIGFSFWCWFFNPCPTCDQCPECPPTYVSEGITCCDCCESDMNVGNFKMILFKKEDFIFLLNKAWSQAYCPNKVNDARFSLEGFYIKPSATGNNTYVLDIIPAYSKPLYTNDFIDISNSDYKERVCNPGLNPIRIKRSPVSLNINSNTSIITLPSTYMYEQDNGILDTDFQFCMNFAQNNPCPIGLEDSFIGYHDLMQILLYNETEYIGVSGTKISTGNYHVYENSNNQLSSGQNENYFTLKFTGFKVVEDGIVQSNVVLERGVAAINHAIPAEHLAMPCPPHWIPQ